MCPESPPFDSAEPAIQWRVIGIGSPFGDDRLGWAVVRSLQTRCDGLSGLECLVLDRPGPALLTHLAGARQVAIVDAMRSGAAEYSLLEIDPAKPDAGGSWTSSHGFGLLQTLALGRTLGQLPPRLRLFGIEMGDGAQPVPEMTVASIADQLAEVLALPPLQG
ncbi:MAG: hydrogenase maturation protease [Halothiobacillaceae bacterium]